MRANNNPQHKPKLLDLVEFSAYTDHYSASFGRDIMQPLQNPPSNNQTASQKLNRGTGNPKNSTLRPSSEQSKPLEPRDSAQTRKSKTNAATLQAHIDVSIGSKYNPMSLIYKTALEGINEALKPSFGTNAAQKIQDSGVDVSAEATAGRIVSLSTAFFATYQDQNKDMALEEQIDSFLSVIGGGVDKGFSEARKILDGFGVLEGNLAENINRTYDLVFDGFAKFRDSILSATTSENINEATIQAKAPASDPD